jgi:hypothetical protein
MREYIGISVPRTVPILAVHDEIVVECDEKDVEKADAWLEKAMINGRMNEVVNELKAHGSPPLASATAIILPYPKRCPSDASYALVHLDRFT